MLKHAFCHVCVLSSWDPRARWIGGNASSKCEWTFNAPFHLTFPNACYCSWPVSKIHLSLVRTVSLKMMHTVLNPNNWNQFSLRISLLARPVHGFGSVQTVRSTPEFSFARPVHRAPGLEYQIKRCAANPNGYEILNYRWQNGFQSPSMLYPKPLQASSMSFTYPSTTKLSKLFTPVFVFNLNAQNQKKSSPLFNKRSSSPSIRVNHRCRHCGTIHSRVSVIPWSFIKVIMCLYLTVSMCFVYWIMSMWSALCGVVFVLILGLIISTSSSDEIQ